MELLKDIYFRLLELNQTWVPFKEQMDIIFYHVLVFIELLLFLLLFVKIMKWLIRDLFKDNKKVIPHSEGGFRRRYERVEAGLGVEYRFDKTGEYKTGICKDISLNGMKIAINDDMPEINQRVEFVLDGKSMKLSNKERVKIGGFVVRVVEENSKKTYDLGIEFYHLFKNQAEMIEAIIKKNLK